VDFLFYRFLTSHIPVVYSHPTRARNENLEVPVYFLKAKQGYTVRKKNEKKKQMNIVHIGKCRYEILEQKEVPVWHTGI
jgi:hypothetical protein